jgi:aminobenzoyl-glutamate utilization protein B
VACIGSPIGEKGIVFAAKVLAVTAVQLLEDADLRSAARADFDARMEERKYTTLIPEGQPAPRSIR